MSQNLKFSVVPGKSVMASRNVGCFLKVRIYYTIALKRGIWSRGPITGSLTTIDNSRWTSDSRWHIFFEPTSKLMMYLLSLKSVKEMTTTGRKDTVEGNLLFSVSVSKIRCLLVLQKLFATLTLRGRPGSDGCQSALWGCFAAMLKMRHPKESHNALDNHLDPVSRATLCCYCVVAYSIAQKLVTSRVSLHTLRESRSARITEAALIGTSRSCTPSIVPERLAERVWWTKSQFSLLVPVPERPISVNPGLKFCSTFCIYLPVHYLK